MWLKLGNVPNQYFFQLVKAKRIWESIKTLALLDGSITKDKSESLLEIHSHYRNLYKKDQRVASF